MKKITIFICSHKKVELPQHEYFLPVQAGAALHDCAHCLERPDAAAVAKRQFCNLAFLPEMTVDTVFLDRHLKHLRRRSTVDVATFGENILSPLFTGKPSDHAGFDGAEVRNDEFRTGSLNKRCSDKLRKRVRHILIEHFERVKVATAHEGASFSQILQLVLR